MAKTTETTGSTGPLRERREDLPKSDRRDHGRREDDRRNEKKAIDHDDRRVRDRRGKDRRNGRDRRSRY